MPLTFLRTPPARPTCCKFLKLSNITMSPPRLPILLWLCASFFPWRYAWNRVHQPVTPQEHATELVPFVCYGEQMNPVFGSFVIHLDLYSLDYYCHCLILLRCRDRPRRWTINDQEPLLTHLGLYQDSSADRLQAGADWLVVVLQQFKLSIEESHNANDGNAKGGGEKHFVEHLFLLVSDPVLGQTARICSPCCKPDWSDNRPARPACQIHCTAVDLSKTQLITGRLWPPQQVHRSAVNLSDLCP